jgi:GxxExxY protein
MSQKQTQNSQNSPRETVSVVCAENTDLFSPESEENATWKLLCVDFLSKRAGCNGSTSCIRPARMKDRLNALTEQTIGAAIAVHHELGPGMLETAYEACLQYELIDRGLVVERQKALPLVYRGQIIECGYRLDLLIEGLVIVEVKATERFERVHSAQLRSYLRLSDCKVGLLINFNVKWLAEDGIKRVVNGFPD